MNRKEFVMALKEHGEEMKALRDSNGSLQNALHLFGQQVRTLAKETGDWRKEDAENHSNEANQREKMLKGITQLEKTLISIHNTLNEVKFK